MKHSASQNINRRAENDKGEEDGDVDLDYINTN